MCWQLGLLGVRNMSETLGCWNFSISHKKYIRNKHHLLKQIKKSKRNFTYGSWNKSNNSYNNLCIYDLTTPNIMHCFQNSKNIMHCFQNKSTYQGTSPINCDILKLIQETFLKLEQHLFQNSKKLKLCR